jgi:hypothetical protein
MVAGQKDEAHLTIVSNVYRVHHVNRESYAYTSDAKLQSQAISAEAQLTVARGSMQVLKSLQDVSRISY